MIEYKSRTKAGRAWIARILDDANVITIRRIEIDNVTNDHRAASAVNASLLRSFVEIDGRDAVVYGLSPTEYVYLTGAPGRYVTKYVIRTESFDTADLPEMEGAKP